MNLQTHILKYPNNLSLQRIDIIYFLSPLILILFIKNYYLCRKYEYYILLIIKHKIQEMSKSINFLPWAMRMVIILFLMTTLIQQDILLYIISSLNLLLIIFCIWGFVKSKAQGIMKALRGNRTHNVFDVVISVLFIITGLCTKDTTMIIEGGLLLIIAISNYRHPTELFPN